VRAAGALGLAALLTACSQHMDDQHKREAYEAAPELPGGTAALRPPQGTFSREAAAEPPADTLPGPVTAALLARGRERFDIYCSPCHGRVGDGRGMVARRGFPAPPSYHGARLRGAPDRHYYDVITDGYGAMASYAGRVPPADRWAIVAWIRTLQLSQHVPVASLPPALRERLP
jgi:mono/diheme cytochrome c family protein